VQKSGKVVDVVNLQMEIILGFCVLIFETSNGRHFTQKYKNSYIVLLNIKMMNLPKPLISCKLNLNYHQQGLNSSSSKYLCSMFKWQNAENQS